MSDYIKKEDAIEALKRAFCLYEDEIEQHVKDLGESENWNVYHTFAKTMNQVNIAAILDLPSEDDTVPVVRCKNCKETDIYGSCFLMNFWNTKDDFCSRGEKKMLEAFKESEKLDFERDEFGHVIPKQKDDIQSYDDYYTESKEDNVNHPAHYEGSTSLECIDVIHMVLDEQGAFYFCLGNAIKYLWRYKKKNGIEDVEKANWYLDHAYSILNANKDLDYLYSDMKRVNRCFENIWKKEKENER